MQKNGASKIIRAGVLLLCASIGNLCFDAHARTAGKPASKAELREISKRGKDLYAWDQAQMLAIKNLKETPKEKLQVDSTKTSDSKTSPLPSPSPSPSLSPAPGQPACLVYQSKDKVETGFGRLSEDKTTYLVDILASKSKGEKSNKIERLWPPLADQEKWKDLALALDIAREEMKENCRETEKLNYAVLADSRNKDKKTFFVYFYPSQKENLGGDLRLTVNIDEKSVLEEHQGHKALIKEKRLATKYGGRKMAYHQAILDEMPEDTDVLHVLSREPRRAEIVTTANFVYRIDINGDIKYLGSISELKAKSSY